jgi:NAD(P)H-dependent flavin oxidoreductase YrpB (nitropropane dioxygenase family)
VVTFWGTPRRRSDRPWIHQCGSVQEARAAHHAGADAVIAQGVQAGGHVRGTTPAHELLERTRAALPAGFPVWLAGGIAARDDVEAALALGGDAVVAGTRFLLSPESDAHPAYKQRLLDADTTILTELFGAGWPAAPHRVVANAATQRWLPGGDRGPGWVRALHRATAPVLARAPMTVVQRASGRQRPGLPLLGPAAAGTGDPETLVDAGPLYAGETVARIGTLRPAGDLVRELAGAA